MTNKELKNIATKLRIDVIEMLKESKSGHPGGSLSAADIITVLYFDKMNIDPNRPNWEERDRFLLSKGHAAPILYAALAEKGYFDKKELKTLRKYNSILQGHPDIKITPGIDGSTGSLGQGLSIANGIGLSAKLDKKKFNVYVMLGDGELAEGQIWEAAMSAAHYKLDNIIAIIDNNGLQIDGRNDEVMTISPINEKFKAFGWHVIEIDGHNFDEIKKAIDEAKQVKDKPIAIIAKTIKGRGISFMEDKVEWHGVTPNIEEAKKGILELKSEMEGEK